MSSTTFCPPLTCIPSQQYCAINVRPRYVLGARRTWTPTTMAHDSLPEGTLRGGRAGDWPTLASLVLREGMNPLVGDPEKFIVFEDMTGDVIGCGQVRGLELASLVVRKDHRGRGVGRVIGKALVDRWDRQNDLFLLCLTSRIQFYEQFGFVACKNKELPRGMQVERCLGDVVASIVEPGQKCVGMILRKNL